MRHNLIAVFFTIFVVAGSSHSFAQSESETWQAGAASVKITPNGPAWMAGYAARTEPSSGVELDLFAKTLVVRDPAGEMVVLVTLDLISVPGPLRKHVEEALAK